MKSQTLFGGGGVKMFSAEMNAIVFVFEKKNSLLYLNKAFPGV